MGKRLLAAGLHDFKHTLILQSVYQHICQRTLDHKTEVCGGLYGNVKSKTLHITHTHPCLNFVHAKNKFEVDIDELLQFPSGLCQDDGCGLVGIYHSHVDAPPLLSAMDRYYLSLAPWVWLIAGQGSSFDAIDIRCYARPARTPNVIDYEVVDNMLSKD